MPWGKKGTAGKRRRQLLKERGGNNTFNILNTMVIQKKPRRDDRFDFSVHGGAEIQEQSAYKEDDVSVQYQEKETIDKLIQLTGPKMHYDQEKQKWIKEEIIIDYETGLSTTQKSIYDAAMRGESFFFTGAAGTGKSRVLRYISQKLREKYKYNKDAVQVVAPTGQSAYNVNGTTIHSYAGLGRGDTPVRACIKALYTQKGKYLRDRIQKTKVLIIDEISMMSAELFDKVHAICSEARNNMKPFGGMQVITCGDFSQLPPVEGSFAFESHIWSKVMKSSTILTDNFRQGNDLHFARILNQIRFGRINTEVVDFLESCLVPFEERKKTEDVDKSCKENVPEELKDFLVNKDYEEVCEDENDEGSSFDIDSTILYTTNRNVDYENRSKLEQLEGEPVVFDAQDKLAKMKKGNREINISAKQKSYFESILSNFNRPPIRVTLKKHAQVVLTKNLDVSIGLANGARGVVIDFRKEQGEMLPVVKFTTGIVMLIHRQKTEVRNADRVIAVRKQIPLILGYAITIHKSQGMTLTKATMDISNCFADGHAYTALSRVESAEGLYIESYNPSSISASKKVIEFYKQMHKDYL